MADRAADDAPQHVTAAFVARDDAVDDQERARADVIGDHLERVALEVLRAGRFRGGLDEILEEIDLVVRVHALQHRGNALEAHAGIDRRLGQRIQHAFVVAVELHEHEVPDLDVAVALRIRRTGRAAFDFGAVVVEDFAARAAGTGVGHLPEVVALVRACPGLVADADAAVGRHADLFRPDVVGFVVLVIDGRPEPVGRQLVDLRQELPRVADRVALEVVAEAEIAQHLEERVVARGVADVLQIVVLAARAHAALGRGRAHVGPLLLAQEHVLELHHARVREEERRVVAGNERARGHDRVPLAFEILQELGSDLTAFHWDVRGRAAPKILEKTDILACAGCARTKERRLRRETWVSLCSFSGPASNDLGHSTYDAARLRFLPSARRRRAPCA